MKTDPQDLVTRWRRRLDLSEEVAKKYHQEWQDNLDAYAGKPLKSIPSSDWVNVNLDAALVEIKKAQLFFQNPDVRLKASEPLMEGRQSAISLHETVINEMLGPDHVDAIQMIDPTLVAVLTTGLGPTKLGYEATTVEVEQPVVDPMTGQPAIGPDGAPVTQTVPVPIHERWFWEPFSPKELRIPAHWRSTHFDKAPWLGKRFEMPLAVARTQFKLPEDFKGSAEKYEQVFDHHDAPDAEGDAVVTGTEVWYRCALFPDEHGEQVVHPELYKELILIDGLNDQVGRLRPSPYQTIDPQTGRLTPDSMIGNPIHVLAIRDLTDSAYPPSDCQLTRAQVNELCKFRTQMVRHRDAAISLRGFDTTRVPPEVAAKIERGEHASMIGFPGAGQDAFWEIARAQYPRENYTAQDYILQDIEKVWAIGANQMGVTEDTSRTATEVQTVNNASQVKLEKERGRVLAWYLRGVAKLDTLIQRFMSPQQYAEILGQQGAQAKLQGWDGRVVSARFAYRAMPDSQIRMDAAQERRQFLQLFEFTIRHPNVIGIELLNMLFRKFGLEPQKLVVPQLPDKGPDAPKVNVALNGDHIDPQLAAFPIVMELLAQGGWKISPQAIAEAKKQAGNQIMAAVGLGGGAADATGQGLPPKDREHPGLALKQKPLSKHAAEETGGMPGMEGMVQ